MKIKDAEITWAQRPDGKWTIAIDGKVIRCVSCNQPIEHERRRTDSANHHCSPRHEGAKEAASTRHEEPRDLAYVDWRKAWQ